MDHRLGTRTWLILPVRLESRGGMTALGRMLDVSLSGAYIETRPAFPLLARVDFVRRRMPPERIGAARIAAFVTRLTSSGLAVEWLEFAPPEIRRLLGRAGPP